MSKRMAGGAGFLAIVSVAVLGISGCGSNSSSSGNSATATPTFAPGGGTYNSSKAITISDVTPGAVLYCTTDGTTPTAASPKCGQPTTVFQSEFLQAIAVAPGKSASALASAAYTIDLSAAATPTFSPAGGSFTSAQQVTIADTTSGANIFYTADGSIPTASSSLYTGPITVSTTETLSAIAVASGYTNSGVATAVYNVGIAVAAPVFSPAAGSFTTAQQVSLSDATSGATIYYTTDGTTPTSASTPYTAPIAVGQTTAISAIAVLNGTSSPVTTAVYTIVIAAPVPAPIFAPGSGASIPAGQAVTIVDGDPSATIYYTLDGSAPTASSTPYAGPVTLTSVGSATVNAIAIDAGNSSPVATATYTVTPATVPAPTFTPTSGSTITAGKTVTIADTDANAKIYYTTDGSAPSSSSQPYTSAGVTLSTAGSATVNAIAIDAGTSSPVASALYTVAPSSVPVPTFNPASGSVAQGQVVLIADTDSKASIYYTTDGTAPSASSTPYPSGGVTLSAVGSASLKAVAIDAGTSSPVASTTYTVTASSVPPPVIAPATGSTVNIGQVVTITEGDAKAKIYYTTDGTAPTSASHLYSSGGFTLGTSGSITVKAIAIDGANSSAIVSATYSVAPASVPAPTFTPASGTTLTSGQAVTIADTDTAATIYYTEDGSTPTKNSTQYTSGITLTASATLKAIAIDTGVSSPVATASYTVPVTVPPPAFTPVTGSTIVKGGTFTLSDSDTAATLYYTEDGSTPTSASSRYSGAVTLNTAGSVTIKAIAIDAGNNSTVATAAYTVTAPSGPGVSGKVLGGTNPVVGASVQLYTAGVTGYGVAPVKLGTAATTDNTGAFTANYSTCPAAPGDLVYVVATGGNAGAGVNADLELMTALGACSGLSSTTTYIVNEVTTVASVYALSPFMTTAPNVGASSTNHQGITNAFATVPSMVDVTAGTAYTHTPDYPTDLAGDPQIVNNSTVPQARIDTLANILSGCVNSNGSGGGCSNLISAATPTGGSAPANTLQAILDIAQNPGANVSALYGLASSSAPYQPQLSAAPNDWALPLTFTGGGLGIAPTVTNGTVTYAGQSFTAVGPSLNVSLALDATGNVWVAAGGHDSASGSTVPILAKFNNEGAPITPATVVSNASTPAVTYGGFNPEPTPNAASLAPIAIDAAGNVWAGDNSLSGDLFKISPALSVPVSVVLGNTVFSIALDASNHTWVGLSNGQLEELKPDGTSIMSGNGQGSSGTVAYGNLQGLVFDVSGGLWGADYLPANGSFGDFYQVNTTDASIATDEFPSGGLYNSMAADSLGNVYTCGDPSGTVLDVFNAAAATNSLTPPNGGRACGVQLLVDGNDRLFAVSNGFGFPSFAPLAGNTVDVFTGAGAAVSPANGYTGTGPGEFPAINPDPNFSPTNGIVTTSAIDASGNLWVLNPDTGGTAAPGNVLVKFVGIAPPVVTPTSVAVTNGTLGVRP